MRLLHNQTTEHSFSDHTHTLNSSQEHLSSLVQQPEITHEKFGQFELKDLSSVLAPVTCRLSNTASGATFFSSIQYSKCHSEI